MWVGMGRRAWLLRRLDLARRALPVAGQTMFRMMAYQTGRIKFVHLELLGGPRDGEIVSIEWARSLGESGDAPVYPGEVLYLRDDHGISGYRVRVLGSTTGEWLVGSYVGTLAD